MFTLLPSLYFTSVAVFRRWNSYNRNDEHSKNLLQTLTYRDKTSTKCDESCENEIKDSREITPLKTIDKAEPVPLLTNVTHRVKSRKKTSTYLPPVLREERRRIFTDELNDDDITYLMKKTEFTREQILAWKNEFLRDCPDGKLSKEKFIEIYQHFYKKGRVTKFCEQAFRIFDQDCSGYMDFVEFLLAVNFTSSKNPEQKIELFFSMYDMDSNGRIDEHEMHYFIESIYELMGIDISDPSRIDSKVHEIFSAAECDAFGCLRKEEFAFACKNDRRIRKLLIPSTKSSNE